ncbi:hypothetical protein BGZ46_000499 [Entomortierella lignicola]|nr:hypothetical protein BGZ46_000499 [Entomortierella lignicola]
MSIINVETEKSAFDLGPSPVSCNDDYLPYQQAHPVELEYYSSLRSEDIKTEKYSYIDDINVTNEENVGLLPTLSRKRGKNNGKGLSQILRLVNIMTLVLIVLFCIAVLNLYTDSVWPRAMPCDTPTTVSERIGQSTQGISNSNSSLSIFDGITNEDIHSTPLSELKLKSQDPPKLPPRAKRIPRPLTLYNETLIDYYRWMHQIQQDPDVETYIKAESEYTTSWIEQSGIKAIQSQLENEMSQIKKSMDNRVAAYPEILDDHSVNNKGIERLEGTQFWDLDNWRYWLDDSVGIYGIYKRRPIQKSAYSQDDTEKNEPYKRNTPLGNIYRTTNGCSTKPLPTSEIQLVLDINRLAEKQQRKRSAGEFSFGSLEIQPLHTSLGQGTELNSEKVDKFTELEKKDLYAAYTFDITGDERYRIVITSLSSDRQTLNRKDLKKDVSVNYSQNQLIKYSIADEGQMLQLDGDIIKDAGPDTRFVKLGGSLYLYFTKLDRKGLSREVWRVKVDAIDPEDSSPPENELDLDEEIVKDKESHREYKPKYDPEIVLREEDERNVLTISETSDKRFLLIESAGQTSSYTYFFSIDNPEKGWNIVRHPEEDVMYNVEHHSGYFYLRTNHGNSTNFKVLRLPVKYNDVDTNTATKAISPSHMALKHDSFEDLKEEVIAHDPEEFLERFEVFVQHFVAWVWRGGLQEIRIFLAPQLGDTTTKLPITEVQRIRPYNDKTKVATLMPGNIRYATQRLFRDFNSTSLSYSNCSYIHPWALFEFNMNSINNSPPGSGEDEGRLKDATRLICQDPFPVGVKYGPHNSKEQKQQGSELYRETVKNPKKEQEIEMAKFRESRIMVPSRHGSKRNRTEKSSSTDNGMLNQEQDVLIPVSIVYYAFPGDNQFPRQAFVSAYGAYGSMTSPEYTPEVILPFLHRGLLYVQVHPRGDGVLGPDWYSDGKAGNKLNTFYDVEDVLFYLQDSGMVEKEGCVVQGRSAGGLVAGWIANRWGEPNTPLPGGTIGDHPKNRSTNIVREMVKAIVTQVPFMDVIADMSDPEIPWVEYEWAEWGSPLQSREIFEVMKGYSPYDRIRNQPYPAMMVMGGLADSRVSYAEPLKYVTKMRGVDGKTNDCQPIELAERGDGDGDKVENKNKMCAGKKDTPLLLQMEEGGHFSGKKSLWMAFALYSLDSP